MSTTKIILLILIPILFLLVSLFVGHYLISPITTAQVLLSKILPIPHSWPDTVEDIILQVRLPRAILAMMVGAGLSISGVAYQGIFSNPLVSPDILGVTAASGLGAALAILFDLNELGVQGIAFLFGILGVFMSYSISRVYKTTPTLMLVLAGVVVAALFSALTSGIKYIADPFGKLPAITFWLMGSLAAASWSDVLRALIPITTGITGLLLLRWRINLLSMGDEEARSLGVRTEWLKGAIILCTTIVTAASVCVAGVIGWIGLIIPHVARMLVGPDHKVLLPASLAVGAAYLLLIDDLARTVASAEIPLGILTACIGAPFFALLLRQTKGGWK